MSDKPACPKCGSKDVQWIGSHKQYPAGANPDKDPHTSENVAYKCTCGMAFTVMIKPPPGSSTP